ncbi:MAG: TetR/AcrR family transcriptional regulator [Eubacteriales bacterium]
MDRRQIKTRKAIFDALGELLATETYLEITVQSIIDRANIGRSTFYSHFETKDALLCELCNQTFDHLFSTPLTSEHPKDLHYKKMELEPTLGHLLYHFRENRNYLVPIFMSEHREIYLPPFQEHLQQLFLRELSDKLPDSVPVEFALNHLVSSFAEATVWWVSHKMEEDPEQIARYFVKMLGVLQAPSLPYPPEIL